MTVSERVTERHEATVRREMNETTERHEATEIPDHIETTESPYVPVGREGRRGGEGGLMIRH